MSKPGNLGLCGTSDLDFSVFNNIGSLGLTVLFSPRGVFFFFPSKKYLVKKIPDKRERAERLLGSFPAHHASAGKESQLARPPVPPCLWGTRAAQGRETPLGEGVFWRLAWDRWAPNAEAVDVMSTKAGFQLD